MTDNPHGDSQETFHRYFPYSSLRKGQEEFMGLIHRNVKIGKNVAIEAATGFGKTPAVLSSALPIADEKAKKIVYCCRTHKQMDRVIEELKEIGKEKNVSGVSLRGRREMCLNPLVTDFSGDTASAMRVCKLLRKENKCKFYNNVKENEDLVFKLTLQFSKGAVNSIEIKRVCRDNALCPYEVVKEVLRETDLISCSYYYLFHSGIRDNFLETIGCKLEDLIIILDEAHNLPELAANLGTCRVSLASLQGGINEAAEYEEDEILAFLEIMYEVIVSVPDEIQLEEEALLTYQDLISRLTGKRSQFVHVKTEKAIKSFSEYMIKRGEEIQKDKLNHGKPPRSFIHSCGVFVSNWINVRERNDYCYLIEQYTTRGGVASFRLSVLDLDPRNITRQVFSSAYAIVSMSGTLTPLKAFCDIMGLKNCESRIFDTPFKRANMLTLISKGVTTKGPYRDQEMYKKYVRKILEIVDAVPKNVGIFTVSYNVLEGILSAGLQQTIEKPLFVESRGSSSGENDVLIREFKSHAKKNGAVLLGVMGGRNAEGEDYPGDEMNAVVLVGVPYARPTAQVKAQIRYYKEVFPGKGKYYGYYLPAHRKLNQAAGRAHRLLNDKASIIFLDYRVGQSFVRKNLCRWITDRLRILEDKEGVLGKILNVFFDL
ncbi:MAG: helicase C-terminal domain-containing protein [Euryarchaeota archaeon]|nr:helicase C-terminal domain-containing protein [Euryarchaeota archaeon]